MMGQQQQQQEQACHPFWLKRLPCSIHCSQTEAAVMEAVAQVPTHQQLAVHQQHIPLVLRPLLLLLPVQLQQILQQLI